MAEPARFQYDVTPERIRQALIEGIARGIQRSLDVGRQEMRASMEKQPILTLPSGRKVGLDPSLPGQPPKRVTGTLARGLQFLIRAQPTKVTGRLVNTADYAPFLEFGTTKMAARPSMRPVMNRNLGKFRRFIVEEARSAIRGLM